MSSLTDNSCASFGSELTSVLSGKASAIDILRAILNTGWRIELIAEAVNKYKATATALVEGCEPLVSSDKRLDKLLFNIAEQIGGTASGPQVLYELSNKYRNKGNWDWSDVNLTRPNELDVAADACACAAKAVAEADKMFDIAQNQATIRIIEKQRAARAELPANDYDTEPAYKPPVPENDESPTENLPSIHGEIEAVKYGDGFITSYQAPILRSKKRWWFRPKGDLFLPLGVFPHPLSEKEVSELAEIRAGDKTDDRFFTNADSAISFAKICKNEMLWYIIEEESGTDMSCTFANGPGVLLQEMVPFRNRIMRRYRGRDNNTSNDIDAVQAFDSRDDATRHAIAILDERIKNQYK